MDKKLIILALVAALGGVGLGLFQSRHKVRQGPAAELIPADKLKGYAENTHIKIVDAGGKVGGPIVAWAITPYGLRPDQVSPTGYGALKALKRQYPDADWISVFIAEDSAMADASNWAGVAELFKDKVTVTGGIFAQAQLDSLARMGVLAKRPSPADLRAVAAVYDSVGTLSGQRWEISQNLMGAGQGRVDKSQFLKLDVDTRSLHAAAKAMGRDPREVQQLVQAVTRYYWLKAGEPL